jgi:prophage antirepressor-like protein
MNELQTFSFNEHEVRSILIDNQPWFVGKDVAEVLGYSNTRKALADHVDDEDKGVTKRDTLGGQQEMTIINESGLYSLILSSKLPTAKQFKRWVTSEVLPAIRKTGMYATTGTEKYYILEAARLISECKKRESLPYLIQTLSGIVDLSEVNKSVNVKKTVYDPLQEFLNSSEVYEFVGKPAKEVYKQFKIFCAENDHPVMNLSNFSKQMNVRLGLIVKRHRVEGELVGFYERG